MLLRTVYVILACFSLLRVEGGDHWAYQPIVRPAIGPSIDSLLVRKQKELGLRIQGPAAKGHLLRRVHLDLTGLSPTPKELQAFLADKSPKAFERVVDRLLDSPHHGERWGRHWMDIWRYSDWYGLGKQLRTSQKHMWRWRDWIVDSLNADKGYDRMILEMLAGDELESANQKVVAGTGFLARNYYLFNRTTWLDNTIEHTAKAFLGMTMNCAKCHDHKYDPLKHEDYYRMRAIFEPHQVRLDAIPGVTDFEKDGLPRAFDDQPEAVTFVHLKGDAKSPDKSKKIAAGMPGLFADLTYAPKPVDLPAFSYAPGTREYVTRQAVAKAQAEIDAAEKRLADTRKALAKFSESKKGKGDPIIADDFRGERPELWTKVGKDWAFRDGMLVRHTAARDEGLVSKIVHPRDFEAVFRYRTTGGATYKSIGIRFDLASDGQNYNQVYTSAHAPGPKVQVFYHRNGKSSYPSTGRKARAIEIGHLYEMRVVVRGKLVNVFLDGEFQLAYELPGRQADGLVELTAFDATCEFHSFELRELPGDVRLAKLGEKTAPVAARSREELAAAVGLAEMDLLWRKNQFISLEARIEADKASVRDSGGQASLAEAEAAAKAEWTAKLSENEFLLKRGGAKADKKKIAEYQKAITQARKKLNAPGTNYTSLAGSLKALETPAHKFGQYPEVYNRKSTGRRLALAKWITDKRNPLTARVAVNHIWMRHFGTPLVESVFDFGMRAKPPMHQDVLDLLAVELMANGWSMKHLHKLIVMSDVFRRSSSNLGADEATAEKDTANHYYWRMNPRRMESQIVRDNLLHLAGTLDASVGGKAIAANAKSSRRSIYFRTGRDDVQKFLSMFDDADFLQCYRRSESVVPQQALALSNSAASLSSAEKIAAGIGTEEDLIESAFVAVLGRKPDHYEEVECEAFLRELGRIEGADMRVRLVHALLNHNDFVTIR
jgi:hypothetical protein